MGKAIGDRGTELTGHPNFSVYHDVRYHPKEVITGVFGDWLFSHRGIFAFTVVLWDLASAAAIQEKSKDKKCIERFRKHPVEDDYKILDFVQAQAPDDLVPWRPIDHPELGAIELGGWHSMYTWRNPPPALLEAEIAPQAAFVTAFASLAPRLVWHALDITALSDDTFHLTAVVENVGFLGACGAQQAKKMHAVRPVSRTLNLPAGGRLIGGKPQVGLGHLEGRSNELSDVYYGSSPTDNRAKAEWLVQLRGGGAVKLTALAERAGVLRRTVSLPPPA